jgi:sodium/bile acid cotransporter 7
MPPWLLRRWFLLALLLGVTCCVLLPDLVKLLLSWLPPRVVVAGALFLIAVSLDSRELGKAVVRPWPALWGVAVSFGVVPPLAILAGWLLPNAPDYRVGLLLAASSPCTLASAVIWTRRAGGNDATALLIVVLTTATSWLVTPLWLTLHGGTVQLDTSAMMLELLLVLLLPVGVGQLLRVFGPVVRTVRAWKTGLGVASQLLVLSVLLEGMAEAVLRLRETVTWTNAGLLFAAAGLSLSVHLAALLIGLAGARWLGFDRPAQTAVAFAGSQKSIPVALLLFERYLQAEYPLALVPVVCYHVGQLVLDTLIADRLRPRTPQRPV